MWKIIHLIIKRFRIQSVVSFGIVNIDDVAYNEFKNVSINDIIRDKLFESNNMLSSVLIE